MTGRADITHAERLQTVHHVMVASMTLMFYDYCLTLGDEVHLFWKAKVNLGDILYFLSRYPTFVDVVLAVYVDITPNVPMSYCLPAVQVTSWFIAVGIGVAELILVLRTFAMWAKSLRVLYVLLPLFTTLFVASLAITGIYLRSVTVIPPPYPSFNGCNYVGSNPIIFLNFVMVILLETVFMGMTAFRVYKDFRGTTNRLISVIYRDGILFFLCLFSISLVNIFVLSFGPDEFQYLLITFQRVMHSLLSCHILIHARRTNQKYPATSRTAKQHEPRKLSDPRDSV